MRRRALLALSIVFIAGVRVPGPRAQGGQQAYTPEQLDQLLAPIALYPDSLLSQVMMAATYPLEIVEAARWSKANPNLKGDAAVAAVKDKEWDVSVKSLVAFPSVLGQMNEHLDWTQKLGDAMLSQEADVGDSIQRLRAKAAAAGNLKSGPQQTVTTQGSGDNVQYIIAPSDPQVVYVPGYDPSWAYGAWPYPAYPPFYFPFGGALARGFFWGLGFAAAGALFGGWNWGGRGQSYANINVNRATSIDNSFNRTNIGGGGRWQHDPDHRRGVGYRNPQVAARYNQGRPGADQRAQYRGRMDANARPGGGPGGVQRPGGPAGGGVQRPSGGPGGGGVQRPGGGPGVAQRPGGEMANRGVGNQRPGALNGVNRGQQINREAARGHQQMNRSGGGGRPAGGGGGGRPGGGGGGGRPGGGGRR